MILLAGCSRWMMLHEVCIILLQNGKLEFIGPTIFLNFSLLSLCLDLMYADTWPVLTDRFTTVQGVDSK